ncbi:unnamed protein product [Tuber aestivum]|uniref:ferroxidase n=1 Tax=Tuber aestivum TaxID=59557 RepID=A0A292PQC5_9PEZI|nr:unnamed protein product [Tuber aestivum]
MFRHPLHRIRPKPIFLTSPLLTRTITHRAILPRLLSAKVSSSHSFQPRKFSTQATPPRLLEMHEYHVIADASLEILCGAFEGLTEERDDIDVEFNSGVLTLVHPNGIYVLNKQPFNRQIWLSSPVSGPKRYDWNCDDWVSARDGSRMKDLLEEEVGTKVGFVGLDPMNS